MVWSCCQQGWYHRGFYVDGRVRRLSERRALTLERGLRVLCDAIIARLARFPIDRLPATRSYCRPSTPLNSSRNAFSTFFCNSGVNFFPPVVK